MLFQLIAKERAGAAKTASEKKPEGCNTFRFFVSYCLGGEALSPVTG